MAEPYDFNALLKPQDTQDSFDFNSLLQPEEEIEEDVPEEFKPPTPKQSETPEAAQTDEALTFEELAADNDYMEMLREYNDKRFGEEGAQQENETDAEYLRRFLTHTREFEFNSLDMGTQLDYIRRANTEDRMKFGYLYSQLDRLPSFYEEGGTGYVSAFRDYGKSLLFDPLNYIGFGAGKAAGFVASRAITQAMKEAGKNATKEALKTQGKKIALEAAAKEASKYGFKKMLTTKAGAVAATGIGVEAGAMAVQDLKQQELDILSQRYGEDTPEERSFGRAAIVGTLGLGMGALGARLSGGLGSDKLYRKAEDVFNKRATIRDELVQRNKDIAAENTAARSADATMDPANDLANGIFDVPAGKEVLEELAEGASPDIARQYNKEVMKRSGDVMTDILREMALTGELGNIVDADTKASEAMAKALQNTLAKIKPDATKKELAEQTRLLFEGDEAKKGFVDLLPENFSTEQFAIRLDAALKKQGLTSKQFINAFGASASEAGSVLASMSKAGKVIEGFRRLDPEVDQALKQFDAIDSVPSTLSKVGDFVRKMDRERRALMVTQIATTMRNVYSAGARVGFDGLAGSLESVMYQMGRNIDAVTTGNVPLSEMKFSLRDAIRDGFGVTAKMAKAGQTADIADALLQHNPRLLANMNRSLNELAPDKELSRGARLLNTLNIGQDMFFRRAVFVDTLERQLRRAGVVVDKPTKIGQFKNIEEFMVSGQQLPTNMLENAVDESLAFTFARIPKDKPGAEGLAYKFLKFNEALGPIPAPIGTAAFPFAKFMVNAMQFQYQYSPLSVITTINRNGVRKQARKLAEETAKMGDMEKSAAYRAQAEKAAAEMRKSMSTAIVGTSALYAAIQFRANNQDIKWYEAKKGSVRPSDTAREDATVDLRPYFPFTPYLAVADLIVKAGIAEELTLGAVKQPETFDDPSIRTAIEGITGAQFRTGVSSYVLDEAIKVLGGKSDVTNTEKLGERVGKFLGELSGGVLTPLRVVRDVQAAYDTEAAYLRDSSQTKGLGFVDKAASSFGNQVLKEIPDVGQSALGFSSMESLPKFESPTREAPIMRQSSGVSQLFGLPRKEGERSDAEKELVKFGIEGFQIVPDSGDAEANALIKKYMGVELERTLNKLVNSRSYKNKSTNKQKVALNSMIRQFRGRAKSLARAEALNIKRMEDRPFSPFDRGQWNKLGGLKRKLADEYYKNKYGKTVLEMQEEEPDINHIRAAIRVANALGGK